MLQQSIDDGAKLTRNINQRRSQKFYKSIDSHSVANVVGESIS